MKLVIVGARVITSLVFYHTKKSVPFLRVFFYQKQIFSVSQSESERLTHKMNISRYANQ